MSRDFAGDETSTDILNAALADFSAEGVPAIIVHEDKIPYLKIQHDVPTGYVCIYRLDTLLLPKFTEAVQLCDYYMGAEVVESTERACLVRTVAYCAMSYLLGVFVVNHPGMFLDTLDETRFLTESIFLHSTTTAHSKVTNRDTDSRNLSAAVRQVLDKVIEKIAERKRDSLADLLNRFPLLIIPRGAGRPPRTKKPEEQKKQEAAEFESRIEQAIRKLWIENGEEPTKTAVAEAMNIGSSEYRLTSFINRLTRRGINYQVIVDRVKCSLENPS